MHKDTANPWTYLVQMHTVAWENYVTHIVQVFAHRGTFWQLCLFLFFCFCVCMFYLQLYSCRTFGTTLEMFTLARWYCMHIPKVCLCSVTPVSSKCPISEVEDIFCFPKSHNRAFGQFLFCPCKDLERGTKVTSVSNPGMIRLSIPFICQMYFIHPLLMLNFNNLYKVVEYNFCLYC